MRLDDADVSALTGWARTDRRSRIGAVVAAPPTIVLDRWLAWNGFFFHDDFPWFVVLFGGLLLHAYVVAGLALWAPGPGAPERVLAGRDPSVGVDAVVSGDDLELGERLTVYGFGSPSRPFRRGMLLETETGRRLWLRNALKRDERHVEVAPS